MFTVQSNNGIGLTLTDGNYTIDLPSGAVGELNKYFLESIGLWRDEETLLPGTETLMETTSSSSLETPQKSTGVAQKKIKKIPNKKPLIGTSPHSPPNSSQVKSGR